AYAAADVVVSRAGALSISELCLVGKPAILVPSPNVAEDHQTKNAMALVNKDAALMIKDQGASEVLVPAALNLLKDEQKKQFFSENIKKLAPITLKARNVTVAQILDLCFKNSNLTYTIKEKVILIVPVEQKRKQGTKRTLTGSVRSIKGEPLPGVSVVIKGTNTGTMTNPEGNFTLAIPEGISAEVLVFSIIGFEKQEMPISESGNMDVVLSDDIKTMDEVVVVGFGKQKKATLTGAISTVGTRELVQSPQANISNALVGRMSGLLAVQRSAEPGADQSSLRIRGVGTFSGAQEPLVMVDGIETPNYNNIDPDEIETVSILKDASSTAVYGVRGANGVLLITTKRGKSGTPQV
ncbi:MAG: SusC/RagA family TonB-linked outer membrane protein, partial [Chitinophagaceae bacterium]